MFDCMDRSTCYEALFDFHEVSYRLVILLKVMYAIIEVFDVIVLNC
jgi:hypothetical protein